jgi:hypothetical protein
MSRYRIYSGAFALLRCIRDQRKFRHTTFESLPLQRCNCSVQNYVTKTSDLSNVKPETLASERASDQDTIAAIVTGAPAALRSATPLHMKRTFHRMRWLQKN